MKKIIVIFVILAFAAILFIVKEDRSSVKKQSFEVVPAKLKLTATPFKEKQDQERYSSIFIPYWSLDTIDESQLGYYDRFFYFGVSATKTGINQDELGYLNLETFAELPIENKYLTLRMLDPNVNSSVLSDEKIQEKIIEETLQLLEDYSFDGFALDLELNISLNENLESQVTKFVQSFYSKIKSKNKRFIVILFGDNFYRKRPYNVSEISKNSDEIMVMAYDFHKSKGEAGPNFPLSGRSKYGYDFQTMIDDYLKYISEDKITIIFGMYGYDWTVDEKKRPIKPARALSLSDIKKEFLEKCQWQDCVVRRDELSAETEINYVKPYKSTEGEESPSYKLDYHIVWFEDEQSVEKKIDYLKKKGINTIGYWVYGYF